jgi:uncharacterized protein YbjT (DUF2867 family)
VAARLIDRGIPVRLASRSSAPRFDWDERATWAPALRGARAAYIAYQPDLAVPGAADAVGALADIALENGVRRLVLLSGRGEEGAERAERALRESGAEWTILRCGWFMQNFSEGHLHAPLEAGELALPAGAVPEPFVDVDDVADVAVAALTDDRHVGKLYELTGPHGVTFDAAVREIAAASGRPMRFVPITMEEFTDAMAAEGVPDEVADLMRYLFAEVMDGRNARPADGVRRALGRAPRDLGAFARAAAAAGAWSRVAR